MSGKGEEDSGPESVEVTEAEGDSLQGFDRVVAAFRKPVGQMKVEGIQDIRFPVYQHLATGFELGDFEPVAGIQPVFQAFRGRSAVRGIHEIVEGLFQCVGLHESVGETKHDVHGGAILVGQFVSVREQQPSRTLEILSLVVRENRLEGTADVVHGLGAEPDHMKAVNDDLSAGQEGLGRIPESPVHIHDHVLHFVPIGEGEQIILDRVHRPGRKDIENAVVQGIRDDALEALTACVSLELVEGDVNPVVGPVLQADHPNDRRDILYEPVRDERFCCVGQAVAAGVPDIVVDGNVINDATRRTLPFIRRNIGVVFQDFRLLEDRSVYENVAFAQKVIEAPPAQIKNNVLKMLSMVGLLDKYKANPKELSGGEQQRVAIARALVNSPDVLLCDEPTGNLDVVTSEEIIKLLDLANQQGTTVLVVTHNLDVVQQMRQRTITMSEGKIISDMAKGGFSYED